VRRRPAKPTPHDCHIGYIGVSHGAPHLSVFERWFPHARRYKVGNTWVVGSLHAPPNLLMAVPLQKPLSPDGLKRCAGERAFERRDDCLSIWPEFLAVVSPRTYAYTQAFCPAPRWPSRVPTLRILRTSTRKSAAAQTKFAGASLI